MTYLAISLYLLGIFPSAAAVGRNVPAGLREYVVVICWPLTVAVSIITGLYASIRARSAR